MTITVRVITADAPARVWSYPISEGEGAESGGWTKMGDVPSHSQRDFAAYHGLDILVGELPKDAAVAEPEAEQAA